MTIKTGYYQINYFPEIREGCEKEQNNFQTNML